MESFQYPCINEQVLWRWIEIISSINHQTKTELILLDITATNTKYQNTYPILHSCNKNGNSNSYITVI